MSWEKSHPGAVFSRAITADSDFSNKDLMTMELNAFTMIIGVRNIFRFVISMNRGIPNQ